MYRLFLKTLIDRLVSLFAIIILSPVFLIITITLYILNSGKPFFFQERPGKNARKFSIIKFKTMNDRRDSNGNLLPDNIRLTPIGAFIRKTSLDEIPQLLNVLKGDMSLIGPRPLLMEYLPLYNERQNLRHKVKPGITGWAQVNGRNAISWADKFEYDIWYVNKLSFALDCKIIWMTIIKVLKSEGVNKDANTTMEKFRGNNI
ncbi:MAG: sugar transferase [Spirochaetales bacterium]|jgi:lipopolysaccharide/colanic/teichoic acid biosynthesis glycosyltransferase